MVGQKAIRAKNDAFSDINETERGGRKKGRAGGRAGNEGCDLGEFMFADQYPTQVGRDNMCLSDLRRAASR